MTRAGLARRLRAEGIEPAPEGRSPAALGAAGRDLLSRGIGRVRTVHHLACTGGTLICRAIQAQPNVRLLSEVDPLSTIPHRSANRFAPENMIYLARIAARPIADATAVEMFRAALEALRASTVRRGGRLVLRDHSHSRFCTEVDWRTRPGLRDMVPDAMRGPALVTVRHPLDNFLALRENGWLHFEPSTLEAYAGRYLDFLDAHEGLARISYEAFTADPAAGTARICAALELACDPGWQARAGRNGLTGDSGRSGAAVAPRARRVVPDEIARDGARSPAYAALCARLGYNPDPAAAPAAPAEDA